MPNTNTPRGLVPLREAGSGVHNGGLNMYYVPATDATALYIGDPVVKNGSADAAGVPGAVRAAVGGPITGVVQGFVPDGTTNMAGYRAASTGAYVLVCDDPDAIFSIQADADITAANIGLNANMATGTGSAYSKRSGFRLDAATAAATATLALKIIGLDPRPGNEFGAFNDVLVKINNHTEAPASAGL